MLRGASYLDMDWYSVSVYNVWPLITECMDAVITALDNIRFPYDDKEKMVPESYVSQYRSRNVAQTMDEEALEVDLSEMGEYSDQDIAYLVRNGYIHDLPALD